MTAMAAQATEPARGDSAAVAPEQAPPGSPRAAAFGRARRHSRRVRFLKFALPLAAAAIAVAFPLYSYLAAPAVVPVEAEATAFSDGKLVMAHPKLEGFTKQNLPYSMMAQRAIQEVTRESVIQLEGIEAKLPLSAGNFAEIHAAHGVYDREKNTFDLDREFTVATTDGMTARLKSAFLDIGKGNMKTSEPVEIAGRGTRITSDTMSVEDHGKVLVFDRNVRVNIDPATAEAAKQGGNEPNAVQ